MNFILKIFKLRALQKELKYWRKERGYYTMTFPDISDDKEMCILFFERTNKIDNKILDLEKCIKEL